MDASVFDYFLDYGSLGLLCAYLAWWNHKAQSRMDSAAQAFQDQLKDLVHRSDEKELVLRSRYDEVISKYDESRTAMISDVATRLSLQEQKLDECLAKMDAGLVEMRTTVSELQVRWKVQDARTEAVRNWCHKKRGTRTRTV